MNKGYLALITYSALLSGYALMQLDGHLISQNDTTSPDDINSSLQVIVGLLELLLAIASIVIALATLTLYKFLKETYENAKTALDAAKKESDEIEKSLRKLKEADILIKAKIEAPHKTLILCLSNINDRNKAFAIYLILLEAYDVLLHNGEHEITPEDIEKMEMAATKIQGRHQFVPQETLNYLLESRDIPLGIKKILMSNE